MIPDPVGKAKRLLIAALTRRVRTRKDREAWEKQVDQLPPALQDWIFSILGGRK